MCSQEPFWWGLDEKTQRKESTEDTTSVMSSACITLNLLLTLCMQERRVRQELCFRTKG